jgi:arylsulfatase A-like enzyme
MRGRKGSLYDGGHRVPCFVRWPAGGLDGGRDVETLTAHVDLLPTLIHLCHLRAPSQADFDGSDITALLKGQVEKGPERELVVQYRQSHEPPVKWNAAVLTERWRLVGGSQLYDIQADPGQQVDVAQRYPEVVGRLRAAYEQWWANVSPRFDDFCRIVLGAEEANPTTLNAFDWHTRTPWNQSHIRAGVAANGFWAVEFAEAGRYEFALRRWPPEVDAPLTASIDGGKSIAATTARLQIGDVDLTQPVPAGAAAVQFTVPLQAGPARLQSWLIDDQAGVSRGAYYVNVNRLGEL